MQIVAERRMILVGPFKVRDKRRTHIVVASATIENGAVNLIVPIHSSLTRREIIPFDVIRGLKATAKFTSPLTRRQTHRSDSSQRGWRAEDRAELRTFGAFISPILSPRRADLCHDASRATSGDEACCVWSTE